MSINPLFAINSTESYNCLKNAHLQDSMASAYLMRTGYFCSICHVWSM